MIRSGMAATFSAVRYSGCFLKRVEFSRVLASSACLVRQSSVLILFRDIFSLADKCFISGRGCGCEECIRTVVSLLELWLGGENSHRN